jgi:hypothetical protein
MMCASGCTRNDSFDVRVLAPDKKPVADAVVSGGFDWNIFGDETNDAGIASIPYWANGWDATIAKDNFYTMRVKASPCARYTFTPTPESLRLIGSTPGTVISFGAETLVTVGYQGQYRVYTYNDGGVTPIDSAKLPLPVKHCLVRGDTFWYATHDSGLFAYSLRDLLHPEQLRHVAIFGYTGPFLVIDSFVVMGDQWEAGPLVVYKIESESLAGQVASVGSQLVNNIALVSHYVVTLGNKQDLPVIFDISDISHPREVYHGVQSEFWTGAVFRNYVVLSGTDCAAYSDSTSYGVLDLTDPANPRDLGRFRTDSRFCEIPDESTAVGNYSLGGVSVLKGSLTGGLRSVAVASSLPDLGDYEYGGSRPPYFVLSDRLLRLVGPSQP